MTTPFRALCLTIIAVIVAACAPAPAVASGRILVDARDSGIVNSFDPLRTIGAAVDSQQNGVIKTISSNPASTRCIRPESLTVLAGTVR